MAPKKKQRAQADADAAAAAPAEPAVNDAYLAELNAAILTIKSEWKDIETLDPLPLTPESPNALFGYVAPWDSEVFDGQLKKDGKHLQYQCGVNMFWLNPMVSVTPFVPISKNRVLEQAAALSPGLISPPLVADASWAKGSALPRGSVLRVSPDELYHAVMFKVAQRINEKAPSGELRDWKRTLLSAPCCFKRFDSEDAKFAAANSIRNELGGVARAVTHSARQTVYNIWGFKARKEKAKGDKFSAAQIAEFWSEHVKITAGAEQLHKKSTIDACLTLHERLFSIPVCERIVKDSEEKLGPDSPWNAIWKLQEVIYRARSPAKIQWLMLGVEDWLATKKVTVKEVTVNALKANTRNSISDVIMQQHRLKEYVLGEWLDAKDFPSYIKAKTREISQTRASYRALYQPLSDDAVDTNWMFSWPKAL